MLQGAISSAFYMSPVVVLIAIYVRSLFQAPEEAAGDSFGELA